MHARDYNNVNKQHFSLKLNIFSDIYKFCQQTVRKLHAWFYCTILQNVYCC